MLYIPINKMTGKRYPPITAEEKKAYDADELISSKYRYEVVQGSEKAAAPPPVEAKSIKPKDEEK
jgi:hypothetical protein